MTAKSAALRPLIEAVDAGSAILADFDHCFTVCPTGNNAIAAYHGSLDAAKSLHEALLPGWFYCLMNCCAECRPDMEYGKRHVGKAGTTARAWLLAILRAYLYEQEAGNAE